MSSDGSDMLNLQVRRSLYTSGACLNARSPGWVGHGGQGYTHTLSLGAGGSAASRARRAGTEGMASGGRIDEFFYGALAQLKVSSRLTALSPCLETWHTRSPGPTVSFGVLYLRRRLTSGGTILAIPA